MNNDTAAPVMALDASNLCSEINVAIVQAWMLFPDDARARDDHVRYALVKEGIRHHAAGRLDDRKIADLLSMALDTPSTAEIKLRADDRAEMAYGAGMDFYNACQGIWRGDKQPMETSKRKIREAIWGRRFTESNHFDEVVRKRFRPVAAFWAAWIDIDDGAGDNAIVPCIPPELPYFLAWADGFRRLGEQTKPKYRRGPILPPHQAVRLPDEVLALLPPGELFVRNN